MCNVKQIARNIIRYSNSINAPVSNLKLQKLLYFAWIEYYKKTGTYLFNEEFSAWQFGPVVPEIYYDYCAYGGLPITRVDFRFGDSLCDEADEVIKSVVEDNKFRSALQLVNETHKPGHVWDYVYRNGAGNRNTIRFQDLIRLECN